MKELKYLQGEVKRQVKKLEELESQVKKLEEFHPDTLEITLRAFLDKVLECFYIHVEKGNLGFEDQSR